MPFLRFLRIQVLPIVVMIGFIPLIPNDYVLTLIYIGIIAFGLITDWKKYDLQIFITGAVVMTLAEYLFLTTGVERFARATLLGVMPLWLPFLWGYAFVGIERLVALMDKNRRP